MKRPPILLVLIGLTAAPASSFQQRVPAPIRTESAEVLLDLVVRDKKGKPIRDLRPDEVAIFEDGESQPLRAFRLITGSEAVDTPLSVVGAVGEGSRRIPKPPTGVRRVLPAERQPRLVLLAFDRLGPDGRRFIQQAADGLFSAAEPNCWFAVVTVDPRLRVIEQFTQDRQKVSAAVARMAGASETTPISEGDQQKIQSATYAAQRAAGTSPIQTDTGASPFNPEKILQQITESMELKSNVMMRDRISLNTLTAVLALVEGLRLLDGRKSVVLFTEGMERTQLSQQMFDEAIGQSNRWNVSFYGIDVRGLTSEVQSVGTRQELQVRMARGMRNETEADAAVRSSQAGGARGTLASVADDFHKDDRRAEAMSSNTRQNLENFAEATGGFLVADTNDFRPAMRRVIEDAQTYYEVSYRPAAVEWDGRFHPVSVRVSREGVTVQARSGYFAIPAEFGGATPGEIPLLKALSANPPPSDLDLSLSLFRFPGSTAKSTYAFALELPQRSLAPLKRFGESSVITHVSCMLLVKGARGQVLRSFTRDIPLHIEPAKLDAYRDGRFLYSDYFEDPGEAFTVEAVALDRVAGRAGVKSVPGAAMPAQPLAISDPVFVRRLDPHDPVDGDPLMFEASRVAPAVKPEFASGADGSLGVFFTIRAQTVDGLKADVVFSQGARVVSALPAKLGPISSNGWVPAIVAAELGTLTPGKYEVRIVVEQSGQKTEQTAQTMVWPARPR